MQRDFPQAHTHAHAHAHTHKARVGYDRKVSSAGIPDGPGGTVPLPSLHRSITSSLHHFIAAASPHHPSRVLASSRPLLPHRLTGMDPPRRGQGLDAEQRAVTARHRSASADQATPPFIPLCLLARVTGLHRLLPGLVRLPDCVHDHPLVLIPLRLWCRRRRQTSLLRSSTRSLPCLEERERLGTWTLLIRSVRRCDAKPSCGLRLGKKEFGGPSVGDSRAVVPRLFVCCSVRRRTSVLRAPGSSGVWNSRRPRPVNCVPAGETRGPANEMLLGCNLPV